MQFYKKAAINRKNTDAYNTTDDEIFRQRAVCSTVSTDGLIQHCFTAGAMQKNHAGNRPFNRCHGSTRAVACGKSGGRNTICASGKTVKAIRQFGFGKAIPIASLPIPSASASTASISVTPNATRPCSICKARYGHRRTASPSGCRAERLPPHSRRKAFVMRSNVKDAGQTVLLRQRRTFAPLLLPVARSAAESVTHYPFSRRPLRQTKRPAD